MKVKIAFFFFLFFISSFSFGLYISKEEIRLVYIQAASDESACKKLLRYCDENKMSDKYLQSGYSACARMMMAKHLFNPLSKLSYFQEGKQLLEKAIENAPENIELRFLRFSTQCHAPHFLNYHGKLLEDKIFLLKTLHFHQDKQLKKLIVQVLLESNLLTPSEKSKI